jgi:hypothetical protein
MKISAIHLLWVLLLAALVMGVVGCASDDPDNESVRPWGVSQPDSNMMIQNDQHSN